MKKLLTGKRAVVTGGSRGTGFAIASALAVDGAQVMVVATRADELAVAANKIRELGGIASHFVSDVQRPENAEAITNAILQDFGGVEILVNAAAVFVWKEFLETEPPEFEKTIATNLAGPFFVSQSAARVMARQGQGGVIINISSIHGKIADPNVVAHCASKFGLIGMTEAMAKALREYDIRVNAICPGAIADDSADRRAASPREKVTQGDIGSLCVYLCSDLAQSITGATIEVQGSTEVVIES